MRNIKILKCFGGRRNAECTIIIEKDIMRCVQKRKIIRKKSKAKKEETHVTQVCRSKTKETKRKKTTWTGLENLGDGFPHP